MMDDVHDPHLRAKMTAVASGYGLLSAAEDVAALRSLICSDSDAQVFAALDRLERVAANARKQLGDPR